MQRRGAWHFKYTEDMSTVGAMATQPYLPPSQKQQVESTVYRTCTNDLPTDSWEVQSCVGYAVDYCLKPRWKEVQQLGRTLTIFKVHKNPMVCELFFMPLDEVVKVYKGRFPKCVEWVTLYDPALEIVFWAELFKPRAGGGRKSLLTDELCGGSGSRFTIVNRDAVGLAPNVDDVAAHLAQSLVTPSREEAEQAVADKQAKLEKNRKKKERQKQKKAEEKAAAEEEERLQAEASEAEAFAAARRERMPAPMLQGFDFKAKAAELKAAKEAAAKEAAAKEAAAKEAAAKEAVELS